VCLCAKGTVGRDTGVQPEGVIRVLQECYKCVTRALQGCYKGATRVLQGCYKGVTRVLQGCYESVTIVLQGCYRVLQGFNRGVVPRLVRIR
jgi:hypothetical protein